MEYLSIGTCAHEGPCDFVWQTFPDVHGHIFGSCTCDPYVVVAVPRI